MLLVPLRSRWSVSMVVALLVFVVAALAQQGADDGDTCPSDSTPSDMLGPFYVAGSPTTMQIAPTELLQDPVTRLTVSGRVLSLLDPQQGANGGSLSSCGTGIPNVTVEVWYAGPMDSQGNYYRTDAFRGQMETDECGRYSFVQVFPSQYPTRPILHDHFRLSMEGTELLVTQLYFRLDADENRSDDSASSSSTSSGQNVTSDGYVATDDAYPLQAQPVQHNSDGSRSVHFDLYLDNVQAGTVSAQSVSAASNTSNLCLAAGVGVVGSNSSNVPTDGSLDRTSTTSGGSHPPGTALAALSTASATVAALLSVRSW
jgi:protocatechuate 3,4-dioxygenase beta subunit